MSKCKNYVNVILIKTGTIYDSTNIPKNITVEKVKVTKQYAKKFIFKLFFFSSLFDLFFIIPNEKFIPFTPSAIRHGIIINSFGKIVIAEKSMPLIPKYSMIKPEVNPVINPLTPINM
jgi:hypothetical protein